MLYNESTGKPKVLSLESLIAWLERKPTSATYNYWSRNSCLAAQYNRAHDLVYRVPFPWFIGKDFNQHLEFIAIGKPRTYGGALTRARAALAKELATGK